MSDGEIITDTPRRRLVVLYDRPELSLTRTRLAGGERGADLHVHREHTDSFYVLEGELTFRLGPEAKRVTVAAGGYAAVPPNVVHGFDNDGDGDASYLNMHTPDAGFAEYLRALRDGRAAAFDSFDPPEDGGLPASEVIVRSPGPGALPPG